VILLLMSAGFGAGCLAFRPVRLFLSGDPLDGNLRTNAGFFRPPTKALHPRAHGSFWHWRPGWHRAVARVGGLVLAVALAYGLIWHRTATITTLAAIAFAAVSYTAWRLYRGARSWARACTWDRDHPWKSAGGAAILPWQHYVHYRRPLTYGLTADLGAPPSKVAVRLDRSAATVYLPPEFTGSDKGREAVTRAVTAKLALEAPEATWKLHGRRPRVTYALTQPPPARLTWDDVAAEIASARPDELVVGVGKRDRIVKVSLELDSPHFGIISGTGGGKSQLTAFLMVQRLMRGDIALFLDAKRFSHPWAFKDMDSEYGLLPNVAYCRTVSDLHNAMCWLGGELDRRNAVTERTINARGDVGGDVGPRMWTPAEEMNLAFGPLKQFWAEIRGPDDPKRSPAFTGLGAVSFAGRAARMHLKLIGQMLRADVSGGGDVRENIGARAMTRYTQNSWKMQAGDIPMPPPSRVPGRWQLIVSGEVIEVQVPYVDMEQARELAVGGVVTACPPGMPGRAGVATVRPRLALPPGVSDQHVIRGTVEEVTVGLTIAEAVADGIFGPLSVDSASRRVRRAELEPTGKRGNGSFTYDRADLFAAARDRRRKDAA
jgi:hypothetical protein